MARIRTIKPQLWEDDAFVSMCWDARLLYIGLISGADDQGRFVATAQSVLGYVFPHDVVTNAKYRRLMREITATGMVLLYKVNGREYGFVVNWHKHQKISHPQPSSLPAPPDDTLFDIPGGIQ